MPASVTCTQLEYKPNGPNQRLVLKKIARSNTKTRNFSIKVFHNQTLAIISLLSAI